MTARRIAEEYPLGPPGHSRAASPLRLSSPARSPTSAHSLASMAAARWASSCSPKRQSSCAYDTAAIVITSWAMGAVCPAQAVHRLAVAVAGSEAAAGS